MLVDTTLIQKLSRLPPDDQMKVAELVESLAAKQPNRPRKDPCGMFSHHAVDMPLEMFQEARREMWANFPREFPQTDAP